MFMYELVSKHEAKRLPTISACIFSTFIKNEFGIDQDSKDKIVAVDFVTRCT
jgi:hypothetical protein